MLSSVQPLSLGREAFMCENREVVYLLPEIITVERL
jgi:hypothetical protein